MTPSGAFKFSIFLLISLALISFSICRNAPIIEKERFLMGTIVRIKAPVAFGDNSRRVSIAIDKAFDEIARVESVFSVYNPDSEVSRINRLKKDKPLKISDEAFGLIEKSMEYNVMTDGAFDITVKPLIDVWAVAKSTGKIPAPPDVEDALSRVGSKYIVLNKSVGTITFKKDGMAIDLGGVAKGYAADRAIGVLKANGVNAAIVNPGGDLYCLEAFD